jgi:hypothetical protein
MKANILGTPDGFFKMVEQRVLFSFRLGEPSSNRRSLINIKDHACVTCNIHFVKE